MRMPKRPLNNVIMLLLEKKESQNGTKNKCRVPESNGGWFGNAKNTVIPLHNEQS